MKVLEIEKISGWHDVHKESKLFGRRIIFDMIEPILKNLSENFNVEQIGNSFNNIPIYKVSVGEGPIKVLVWSQMHGNESTGTKAVFDLFRFLSFFNDDATSITSKILTNCTLVCIPMLNPDGAEVYTRLNAQHIDLNRDAVDLKAPESTILNKILNYIKPKFCFNLHDQRTIFSVGEKRHPATMSFLAPSVDESRKVTEGRKITMSVIVSMYEALKGVLPGQIGRYTDEFYPTATGDNFQKRGHNTILIEAGHFKNDYDRELVRKYNFMALLYGLYHISTAKNYDNHKLYVNIPNNDKYHLDIIYKNVILTAENKKVDVGVLFKEELINDEVIFTPEIERFGDLSDFNANRILDMKEKKYTNENELKELIKN